MIKFAYDKDFKLDDKYIPHSYPNTPPGYTNPQITYYFYYEGFMSNIPLVTYEWSVTPPFYIISGQGTSGITCQNYPVLRNEREQIVVGKNVTYRDYKYADINLKVGNLRESRNLYYAVGPQWEIQGNINPIIKTPINGIEVKTIETYTLVPLYDQTGIPPKYSTDPNTYSFDIKNGKVVKFYGGNPPNGTPKVDIYWYKSGSGYLSFYSAWSKNNIKYPNTLNVYVSEE